MGTYSEGKNMTRQQRQHLGAAVQKIMEYRGVSPRSIQLRYAPARGPLSPSAIYRLLKGEDEQITDAKLRKLDGMLDLPANTLIAIYHADEDGARRLAFENEAMRQFILDQMVTPGVAKKVRRAR